MEMETTGTVLSVSRQWWLKINRSPVRVLGTHGAVYPHIVKVRYAADGIEYVRRKWVRAGDPVPRVGASAKVLYAGDNPKRARVILD